MSRKALCIGINFYENCRCLKGCVNDANLVAETLSLNGDNHKNFDVELLLGDSTKPVTKKQIRECIEKLFAYDDEIALLYYSGHGTVNGYGGFLCPSELEESNDGLSFVDIMSVVNKSKARNKIVILDCCYAGNLASSKMIDNTSILPAGTTILTACDERQTSIESAGHGIFTKLFVEALNGGAMNLLGDVTPGSIYSYIDSSLGAWEQRPVFKANINTFVSLKRNIAPIEITMLKKIVDIFEEPEALFKLSPQYEPNKVECKDKTVDTQKERVFGLLQKYVSLNLVVPVGEKHMYYAAINSKHCKLTSMGQYYWNCIKNKKI